MAEKDDCPVQDATCIARMATLDEKIKGITRAIYATGTAITIILSVVTLVLKLWKG